MEFKRTALAVFAVLTVTTTGTAQTEPALEHATAAILKAFQSHDIVILGENHGNKQEYEWLRSLVDTPEFAERVDDIVMEFGNSLYQEVVDQYVRGAEIPLESVQGAWLDTVGSVGPPSPVYASFYRAVRETNLKRKGKHAIRVLCGDPAVDWNKVTNGKDILPYLSTRDQSYTQVVKNEVMAKHRRALLIVGVGHVLRDFDVIASRREFDIERQLRGAGANPYLIVTGTNTIGGVNEVDHRFDSWPTPVIVSLADNWVGELPAVPVVMAGRGPSLPDLNLRRAADALLYLGPQTSLITVSVPRSELEGTPYGREIERRMTLQLSLER